MSDFYHYAFLSSSGIDTTQYCHRLTCGPPRAGGSSVSSGIWAAPTSEIANGDIAPVNSPDGEVNVSDLLISIQIHLGQRTLSPPQYANGDMNQNGFIDLPDVLLIEQAVLQ